MAGDTRRGDPRSPDGGRAFPVAIAGMHRSGTSMITRGLHESGLHLIGGAADAFLDVAHDNPEGFWENKAIVACNDDLLEATGGAWDDPPELPPQAADDPRVTHLVEPAESALAGLRENERWGFKDPRTCLTAAFWLDLQSDLRFVVCVRHPLEVALSLKRRNQNSYSLGLSLWERYYSTLLELVPRERRLVTHYDAYFADPRAELGRICGFLELDPGEPHVRSDLRHHDIRVSLEEAGIGAGLRSLYRELCREAGLSPPADEPATPEHVRRLVLDGAVAARHAEQRQAAIERLEERLAEMPRLRRELSERQARDRLAERLGALEYDVRAIRARVEEPLEERYRRRLTRTVRRGRGLARRLVRRYALRPGRRAAAVSRRRALPAARRTVQRLPMPVRSRIWRTRRALESRPSSANPALLARAANRRLPPPARRALDRGREAAGRTRHGPQVARVRRAVVRRVPPSVRAVRHRLPRPGTRSLPGTNRAPVPKGPAYSQWADAYAQLVRDTVPDGDAWAVITPGGPEKVRTVAPTAGTAFPPSDQHLERDLSYVAALEALAHRGIRYLVVPEGSRRWLTSHPELRDHVERTSRMVADREMAGTVFDLSAPPEDAPSSLLSAVGELSLGRDTTPAVLCWTDLDISGELPGITTFQPPPGSGLPYLDDSVEIVVRDAARDRAEAERVAVTGLITVDRDASGRVSVVRAEPLASLQRSGLPPITVVAAGPGQERWRATLGQRVRASGAELVWADQDTFPDLPTHAEVVVYLEPHVLPLPGSIEAAAAEAGEDPASAVAAKLMGPDGRLDAAGGTVFADGSLAGVAHGWADVSAPWHEFRRPVCWAPGMLVAAVPLWRKIATAGEPLLGPAEWCARSWAAGAAVLYHPHVTAVRVADSSGAALAAAPGSWQPFLERRPQRPPALGEGEWRYLVAHEDIGPGEP